MFKDTRSSQGDKPKSRGDTTRQPGRVDEIRRLAKAKERRNVSAMHGDELSVLIQQHMPSFDSIQKYSQHDGKKYSNPNPLNMQKIQENKDLLGKYKGLVEPANKKEIQEYLEQTKYWKIYLP